MQNDRVLVRIRKKIHFSPSLSLGLTGAQATPPELHQGHAPLTWTKGIEVKTLEM